MKLHLASALLVLGAAGLACSTRGAPVEAPVELAVAPVPKSADAGPLAPPRPGGDCSLRVALYGRIEKSSPGCYLDEHITKGAGLLHYPCSGDGPVSADFGDHHYAGRITGGDVELEVTTELDWPDDGCRWGTRAVISGTLLSNGQPAMKNLTWRYRDHVINGTACSQVCNAKANLVVTSAAARAPAPPTVRDADDDDDSD